MSDGSWSYKEGDDIIVAEGILQNGMGIDQWLKSIGAPEYQWAGYSMTVITPDHEIIHFCGNMMVGEDERRGGGKIAKETYANIFTHHYDVFTPAVNFAKRHAYMDINNLPAGTRIIVGKSEIVDANLERLKHDPRFQKINGILKVKNDFYPEGKQRLQIEYLERASGWKRVKNPDNPNYLYIDAYRDLTENKDRKDIEWKPSNGIFGGITRRGLFDPRKWKIT